MSETLSHRLTEENAQLKKRVAELEREKEHLEKVAGDIDRLCEQNREYCEKVVDYAGANAELKQRVATLEARTAWREIEKEKPPRGDLDVRYSVEVEVRLMLKWGDVEGVWEKGFCRWDYAMKDWDSLRRWTHWKPLSDNPEVVSDGT